MRLTESCSTSALGRFDQIAIAEVVDQECAMTAAGASGLFRVESGVQASDDQRQVFEGAVARSLNPNDRDQS